jgi:para-nitrobenzyl esterase
MEANEVKINNCIIRGVEEDGVLIWKGIPYAAAPVGDLRFCPPQPYVGTDNVIEAFEFKSIPWQPADSIQGSPKRTMDEDCLYLNIWSKKSDNKNKPVLFWIYGGGFTTGEGSMPWYDGRAFAKNGDIIVVTFNYRLGAYGFLYLGEVLGNKYDTSGNNGILDQIAALNWVRENIAYFGGDPDNITIAGQSAGAFSVGALMSTSITEGKFRRAIFQSGSVGLEPTLSDAKRYTNSFLSFSNLNPEQLLTLGAADIMKAQTASGNRWWPIIDNIIFTEPLISGLKKRLIKEKTDLLIGYTLNEMNHMSEAPGSVLGKVDLEKAAPLLFDGNPKEITVPYKNYPEERPYSTPWEAFLTDMYFRAYPTKIALFASDVGANVWFYRFDWPSRATGRLYAAHALELPFVFNNLDDESAKGYTGDTTQIRDLAKIMQQAWIKFITAGDLSKINNLPYWPCYDLQKRYVMLFNNICQITENPQPNTLRFWDVLSDEAYEKLGRKYNDGAWKEALT